MDMAIRVLETRSCSTYIFRPLVTAHVLAEVEPSPLLLRPLIGLLYQPWMINGADCGAIGEMNDWQGKPKYWDETCHSTALSTTDPT
jgi:hypothetical protein